jgi:Protein of unknown function (DUF4012)
VVVVDNRAGQTDTPPRPPSARRQRWSRVGKTLLLLILAFVVVVTVRLVQVAIVGDRAQSELQAFKTALQKGNMPLAQHHLAAAKRDIASARSIYRGAPVQAARRVPVLHWVVTDSGHLLDAAQIVATASTEALGLYGEVHGDQSKLFHDQTVDLTEIPVVARHARRMTAMLSSAEHELQSVHGWFWEPKIGHARDSALRQVMKLRHTGLAAEKLLAAVPSAVGADGPRTYLVVVLNPAELQGAGGSALNMMTARFVNGRMEIVRSGSTFDLTNNNSPTHWRPLPIDPWLRGSNDHVLAAADRSPDFRTSGRELMLGYEAQFHQHVSGIIALDPLALQALMPQIGSFTTPGYGLVNGKNLARKTLIDAYASITDVQQRHLYNDLLMTEILHRLLAGGHMLPKGRALQSAARAGHIQVLMNDPALQSLATQGGLLRMLPPPVGDVVGAFTANGNASKVDVWQQRHVDEQVTIRDDGSVDVTRTVTITNDAPPYSGPDRDPRSGYFTRWSHASLANYMGRGAQVEQVTVDGVPARPTMLTERGLVVAWVPPVWLRRGQQEVVVLHYRLPAGTARDGRYHLSVVAQPTYLSGQMSITVHGPGSCETDARGWTTNDDSARFSGRLWWTVADVRCA